MNEPGERVTIELPSDLVARIDHRRRETGFESIDAYVQFTLEQVLRSLETGETERDDVDAADYDDVRDTLRDLGYL